MGDTRWRNVREIDIWWRRKKKKERNKETDRDRQTDRVGVGMKDIEKERGRWELQRLENGEIKEKTLTCRKWMKPRVKSEPVVFGVKSHW